MTYSIIEETVEVIRDLREYLNVLTETGVEGMPFSNIDDRENMLKRLRETIGDCRRCKLWKGRKNIVFGSGNPHAKLMFIGEGPGEEEDLQGLPFVGRAGELLTRMIEAMGLRRDDVYIANIVKCRPPKNRAPEEDEIQSCHPFLSEQIRIVDPEVICTLGATATQTILKTKSKISKLRGEIYQWDNRKVVPTFHPSYLLRNPGDKRLAWNDLKLIMKVLGLKGRNR